MKRRSIETSILKDSTAFASVRTRTPSARRFMDGRNCPISGTVTLRPEKRRPKARESLRNSVSLGNLDTIEEWPESEINLRQLPLKNRATSTLDSRMRRKKSLSRTISRVSKSILTYSRTAVSHNPPTQVQCLPKLKFNPKLKSSAEIKQLKSSMRRVIKKITTATKAQSAAEQSASSPKKTPILAQREIIVENGITIWEEEMTADDSFDYSCYRN